MIIKEQWRKCSRAPTAETEDDIGRITFRHGTQETFWFECEGIVVVLWVVVIKPV